MKASDEEEYGSFYTTSRSGSGAAPRYRYREYSPSRGHHSSSPASTMGDPSAYNLGPSRAYSRTPPYGASGRTMVEYQPPPCCHQFYHPPPPPIPLHPSPSHFNTIPHPPLQYRDVPACATLNRSCYTRRSNNHPYSTYYGSDTSTYGDPRSDIYYTSTLSRHPRHSVNRNFPSENEGKIYDTPSAQNPYHHPGITQGSSSSGMGSTGHGTSSSSLRTYGVGVGAMGGVSVSGGPPGQSSNILRLEEPRIYSTSSLQLGSNPTASLQRPSSPQHSHYIDRSISLIRLDNSGSAAAAAAAAAAANNSGAAGGGNSSGMGELGGSSLGSSVTLSTERNQPRFVIKFSPDIQSQSQRSNQGEGAVGSNLVKTTIELGSSNDPLAVSSVTPNKSKYKSSVMESPSKKVVEMSDKAVMTTQLPEQWSLMSSGSESRRISLGATSPPGNSPPPAPTLSGGVPDLLPTCVVRHSDYPTNNPWVSPVAIDLSGGGDVQLRRYSLLQSSEDESSEKIHPSRENSGSSAENEPKSTEIITCYDDQFDTHTTNAWDNQCYFCGIPICRRNSGNIPSPRRGYHVSGAAGPSNCGGGAVGGQGSGRSGSNKNNVASSSAGPSGSCHGPGPSSGTIQHGASHGTLNSMQTRRDSQWAVVRKYIREATKTFFGLDEATQLKEEWLSRRKRFASRRYSERNVDSMPPPSPYQQPMGHYGYGHAPHGGAHMAGLAHDQPDGRVPSMDQRAAAAAARAGRAGRTRKKDHVFVIYWNLLRWIFWSLRFGRTGQRVAAGAGCGSDTNPGAGSTSPGRVPLDSQMSRDRTKSRSISPATLAEIPPNITISPQEMFFDDLEDNHRNSAHHLQPPGRGLHWRIARTYPSSGGMGVSNRISTQFLNKVLDNSERQQFRQGLRQPTSTASKLALIDEYEDFRPYFTYWISVVQIIILVVSMITYGLAPVGLDLHRKSSLVLVTSLSLQQMEIIQPANFWIGPSAADLIHLGAKFAPCMRMDEAIHRRIIETRDKERQTACCIRNDNSGCVQSSRNECSGLLSTWKKWTREEGPGGRISGSVCGLDPKFCEAPASVAPYEWPDDITKWPICRKTRGITGMTTKDKTAEHMVCEVIGHPCCIGIHAKCVITTREYCRFVNGYFHEEASLCSQVSCVQDVCGMFPFIAEEQPDQVYRLISSLFLHAGLGHIMITLTLHWFILRDLEKLAGPLRVAIIYLGSGIAGNLASVLLEPHRAEVGPGGGQYGLMACLLVELLHMWGMLRRPWQALGKMLLVLTILFLIGFLPWVDNFAHIVGFCAGFLLSHAFMPYIAFGKYSTYRKWLEVVICLAGYFAILVTLLVIFYAGFGDCEICKLLNCLPLTKDFCAEQDIDFKPSGSGINLVT